MRHRAYILLGSNVEKERHTPAAIRRLAAHPHVAVVTVSSTYETAPVGSPNQPTFYNVAIVVETPLDARALKWSVLRPIEEALGRVRTSDPNAPRTVDLDIVLFDHDVFELDGSSIPDPNIERYAHVALPLAEVAPDYVHPVTGETLAHIARRFAGSKAVLRVLPPLWQGNR